MILPPDKFRRYMINDSLEAKRPRRQRGRPTAYQQVVG